MRILFLDFDGVLNNEAWMQDVVARRINSGQPMRASLDRDVEEIDPSKVKLVNDFCIEQQLSIAISSSWRGLMSVNDLRTILWTAGLEEQVDIVGVTPDAPDHFRGKEVMAFFDIYLRWFGEEITDYVIFDDSDDFYSFQPLVKTTWEEGLLPSHIAQARELLNK